MEKKEFSQSPWTERLAKSLRGLSETQKPFLETYWQTTGYPARISFNGKDETAFPWDDYISLYEDAQLSYRTGNSDYYAPLLKALETVYDILREHPVLAGVPEKGAVDNAFHVSIVDTTALSTFGYLVAGQMAQNDKIKADQFKASTAKLNSLLQAPIVDQELNFSLLQGKDIALFHGVCLEHEIELCEGFSIAPFHLLQEHLDPDWIRDLAAQQVDWRRTEAIFGIVRNFNWRPGISTTFTGATHPPRTPPPLLQRWADEFCELMSVSLECRISWLTTFEGCVSQTASELLGQQYRPASHQNGPSISHLFSAFQKAEIAPPEKIEEVSRIFSQRSELPYAQFAPVIHRFAEAYRREGRFAAYDRVLDLAIVFEWLFKPKSRINQTLQEETANLLGQSESEKERLRAIVKHLYGVRSAIVHGPTSSQNEKRLREVQVAWKQSAYVGRRAVLKKLTAAMKSE